MADLLSFHVGGNLGTNEGAGADGVLIGALTDTAASKALLKGHAQAAGLCTTDDGGAYVDLSTEFNEATADDVPALPATPANDDAIYFGHATKQFGRVDVNLTTDGDGTWTVTYQYKKSDGTWANLAGVSDATSGFVAGGTGWMSLTFTVPEDWIQTDVDGVYGYWIRGVVSGYSAVVTRPLVGQGYIVVQSADATWTDDTTDFNDAGAGDVALLPAYPVVGDGFYIGHATEKFCKLKVTTSQARTGTATLTLKYWDGSAWSSVTTVDDDSVGWSAVAGTLLVNFIPPADWTANTAGNGPNGEAGYFVVMELTAMTSVTQQPLGTIGYTKPLTTGASGVLTPMSGTISKAQMNAGTDSGSTADSQFLLINCTKGTFESFTWTKDDPCDSATIALVVSVNDQLALVQVVEDGSTEYADADFHLTI